MKFRSLLLIAALTAIPSFAHATTGFTGAYSPANATIATSNGGSIDTSGVPGSITLFGGSDENGASEQLYQFTLPSTGTLSFNWNYTQNDIDGPFYDPFGYNINDIFTKLTNDNGSDGQSGFASVLLNAGDIFAFNQVSLDSFDGFATTTISNLTGPGDPAGVPEPATWAMILVGFGLIGGAMRRKQRQTVNYNFA